VTVRPDAALKVHRVHAGGNELHAFINDGLSENRSSGRTVTGVAITELKKLSKPTTTNKEIAQVGAISANSDEEIGQKPAFQAG